LSHENSGLEGRIANAMIIYHRNNKKTKDDCRGLQPRHHTIQSF